MERLLAAQTLVFLYAVILGLTLGVVYDVLRCLRLAFAWKKLGTALCDIAFCFVMSAALLIFLLAAADGEMRGYIAAGLAIGLLLYFAALSDFVRTVISAVMKMIGGVARVVRRGVTGAFTQPRGN